MFRLRLSIISSLALLAGCMGDINVTTNATTTEGDTYTDPTDPTTDPSTSDTTEDPSDTFGTTVQVTSTTDPTDPSTSDPTTDTTTMDPTIEPTTDSTTTETETTDSTTDPTNETTETETTAGSETDTEGDMCPCPDINIAPEPVGNCADTSACFLDCAMLDLSDGASIRDGVATHPDPASWSAIAGSAGACWAACTIDTNYTDTQNALNLVFSAQKNCSVNVPTAPCDDPVNDYNEFIGFCHECIDYLTLYDAMTPAWWLDYSPNQCAPLGAADRRRCFNGVNMGPHWACDLDA